MREMLKKLTRKQIIIIVSSLVVITGIVVGTVLFLNRGTEEEIKKCLVEFDVNGGTFISSRLIECGTTTKEPSVKPEKIGFEFIGWYLNEEEFDFNNKINENIILIANYNKITDEELVIVTFDSAGGTEVKSIELVKGTTITEPVKPTRNGYTFEGWYLNEEKFDFSKEINESLTLIARWKENKNNQSQGGNTGNSTKPNGGSSGNQGGNTGENNNPSNPGGDEEKPNPKPDEKDKYTYVGEASTTYVCNQKGYELLSLKCYKVGIMESYYGCRGEEVNGKCYSSWAASSVSFSCNPGDEYVVSYRGRPDFCRKKVVKVYEPYSDGTCSATESPNIKINSDGKCEHTYFSWADEDTYDAYREITCPPKTTKMKDSQGHEFCGRESSFETIYKNCPLNTDYYYTSGNKCYDAYTETSPTLEYSCGGKVGNKPEILIGDKCYIEN